MEDLEEIFAEEKVENEDGLRAKLVKTQIYLNTPGLSPALRDAEQAEYDRLHKIVVYVDEIIRLRSGSYSKIQELLGSVRCLTKNQLISQIEQSKDEIARTKNPSKLEVIRLNESIRVFHTILRLEYDCQGNYP